MPISKAGNKAKLEDVAKSNIGRFLSVCFALLAIQAGFGFYGVLYTKLAKGSTVEPLVFCLYRDAGCTPVLFLAGYVAEKCFMVPKLRELPLFFFMGFFGMFLNQFSYILGIVYTTPDTASMFQPLVPVVVTIVAIIMRTEPFPRINTLLGFAKLFGILLATGGALLMTYGKQEGTKKGDKVGTPKAIGYVFLMLNVTASAIWVVTQKKYIFNKVNSRWKEFPINVTAWTYFFGAVCMGLASFYYTEKPEKFKLPNAAVLYCLIYAIFVTSALCYMLITWCNMQVNSSFVTASWPLQVLFCILLSYLVLGETLVLMEIFGGLLIITALMAVTWSNYKEQARNIAEESNYNVTRNHDSEDYKPLLSPS